MSNSDHSETVRRSYLHLGGGRHIHYRTVETDRRYPLVLIFHQTPLHSGHYSQVLPLLARFSRPVAVDTPGYGLSDAPDYEWEIPRYAELAWEIVDALGADEAVLLGRATGSIIALEAAHLAPQRTRGMILHGLPVYTEHLRAERLESNFARPIPTDQEGRHLLTIWSRIREQYPFLDPSELQWHLEAYLACGSDFGTAYRAMWRYDPTSALESVSMPVHLLGGDRDRVFGWFDKARQAIPTATHYVFPGGTDFVAAEEPRCFSEQIRSFLSGLEARGAGSANDHLLEH